MADTDLLTLTEAQDVLEVSDTDHDDELNALIAAVSQRMDDMCGPVVARTITDELHSGGGERIWLHHSPIFSVTTLTEYRTTTATTLTAETNASKPSDGYLIDGPGKYGRFIRRRSSGSDAKFASGRRNIEVTYQAGRFADTESVDELFKRAAVVFVLHLWGNTAPSWHTNPEWSDQTPTQRMRVPGFATPHFVRDLLADELRPPVVA